MIKAYKFAKRSYRVRIRRGRTGEPVYNVLEDAHYSVNDKQPFILTGTVGEQWCIGEEKLLKQYQITKEQLDSIGTTDQWLFTRQTPECVWASLVPIEQGTFTVDTSWGTTLTGNSEGIEHMYGDFKVYADLNGAPNTNDCWIVNGYVFFHTYQAVEE